MGTNHPKLPPTPTLSLSSYHQCHPQQHTHRSSYGTFTTYQHNLTQQKIDKYTIQFSSKKQQQNYYECYLQRYRQEYIVNTVDYVDLSKSQFCSNLYTAEVYVEHVPVRLVDIIDIPYPDNLYIFRNCLGGFGLLYQMIGYFEVEEDHICINSYGEVKVWLNSDLSKNYPQDYNQQIKSQCDMVHKILTLIQNNTNIEQCPIQLSQYFIKKHKKYPNFSQAQHLLDQYVAEYKAIVPKYCQSIFQLFKDSKISVDGHGNGNGGNNGDYDTVALNQIYERGNQGNGDRVNTNMGTVELNQDEPVVPILDIQGMGRRHSKEENVLRDTIKKQTNLYAGNRYRFISPQQSQPQLQAANTQKTQRLDHNTSQRTSLHNNNIIHSYNRLQTKRTPMRQSMIYKISSQIIRPIIHFTYNSPQPQLPQLSQLSQQQYFGNSYGFRGFGSFGGTVTGKPISVPYLNANHNPNQNVLMKSNANVKISQDSRISINMHPHHIIPPPNIITFQKRKQPQNTPKPQQPNPQSQPQPQKNPEQNPQKPEPQPQPQPQFLNPNEKKQKTKPQIFYYDIETGSEEIDPEIAADLIKYL